jgi:hypothetical protein
MRMFGIAVCLITLTFGSANTLFGDDKEREACTSVVRYMADFYSLYEKSGNKTDPQQAANLKARVDHKLMDDRTQIEVFVALARYEFACRACFYLGWDSECAQIPHYSKTVTELMGCLE